MDPSSTSIPSIEEAMKAAGLFEPAAPSAAVDTVTDTVPAMQAATEATAIEPTPAATPATLDTNDRRVQALMAREAELLKREQAIQGREASIRKQAEADHLAQLQREYSLDPLAFARRFAPSSDPGDVATDLWYERLGDAAPAEYKAKKAARQAATYAAENARLQAEREAETKRQSEAQAQQVAIEAERAYVASLQAYTSAVPDSLVRMKSLASSKPEMATRMLHEAASMIAAREERVPTPDETAKAVEQYLADIGYSAPAHVETPAQPSVSAPAPTSLRNAHSAGQGARAPIDPNDDIVRRRNALAAVGLPADLLDHIR